MAESLATWAAVTLVAIDCHPRSDRAPVPRSRRQRRLKKEPGVSRTFLWSCFQRFHRSQLMARKRYLGSQ